MNTPFLSIQKLSVDYEQYNVLHDVEIEICQGEIICVLGKNGSGKSTLLKSIAGLTEVSSGEIMLMGKSITHLTIRERIDLGIGYLMQHDAFFPRLSVEDHILLASQHNRKQSISQIWSIIAETFPDLIEIRKQMGGRLSGGQSRFLSLAMLIAQGTDTLWLLDEPSSGIAKDALDIIGKFLKNYLHTHKITCLLVEQNRDFGELLATKVTEIHHKELLIFK